MEMKCLNMIKCAGITKSPIKPHFGSTSKKIFLIGKWSNQYKNDDGML